MQILYFCETSVDNMHASDVIMHMKWHELLDYENIWNFRFLLKWHEYACWCTNDVMNYLCDVQG